MQLAVTKMHLLLSDQSGNEVTVSSIICYVIKVISVCYCVVVTLLYKLRVKSECWARCSTFCWLQAKINAISPCKFLGRIIGFNCIGAVITVTFIFDTIMKVLDLM